METTDAPYPVRFDIDYPEEPRNRLTSAFRLILAIPILAVIAAIGAAGWQRAHGSALPAQHRFVSSVGAEGVAPEDVRPGGLRRRLTGRLTDEHA